MTIHLASFWLESILLLSVRIGVVLFATPILGSSGVPVRIRALLVVAFSIALMPLLSVPSGHTEQSAMSILVAILNELFWGGLFAFSLQAAFSAFMVGGRILDMQAGFSMATLLDPSTRTHSPLIGVALHMYAITWFLAIDAHHAVIRGLAKSVNLLPLGSSFASVPIEAITQHFALMFSLGMVLVAATVFCLLLIDIGMGIASRVLPQANVFVLSPPIKIVAALSVLSVSVLYMQPVMKNIFKLTFDFWDVAYGK